MKKVISFAFAGFASFAILFGCQKENAGTTTKTPNLPAQEFDYSLKMPASFGGFVNGGINGGIVIDPSFNGFGFGFNSANPPVTNPGATLGRVLFYDPQLSLNNTVACATCHHQERAFADGAIVSTGFGGKVTSRNSMAIINPGFNSNLFWDSRSSSVRDLVTKPIQNHIEMGIEDMASLTRKLAQVDYYPALFQKAYGTPYITEDNLADALAQFVCSITTSNSRFDQEEVNNFAGFNTLEKMGKDLFMGRAKCGQCHAGANFAAADFPGGEYGGETVKGTANIGLDMISKDPGKDGQFRIPSLRNIALTAPYMHDGRFKTLEEVVDHYNGHIALSNTLDPKLRNIDGSPLRLGLDALDKRALLAFLNTLTDESMTKDIKYSNPFN